MPHFSATAEARAHDPWTVEVEGRVHTARPVSRPAVLRFFAAIEAAADNEAKQEAALRALLRIAFPARWRYVIQPSRDPVDRLLALDMETRAKALESFFSALAPSVRLPGRPTNGPSGKPPSSAAPTP